MSLLEVILSLPRAVGLLLVALPFDVIAHVTL